MVKFKNETLESQVFSESTIKTGRYTKKTKVSKGEPRKNVSKGQRDPGQLGGNSEGFFDGYLLGYMVLS